MVGRSLSSTCGFLRCRCRRPVLLAVSRRAVVVRACVLVLCSDGSCVVGGEEACEKHTFLEKKLCGPAIRPTGPRNTTHARPMLCRRRVAAAIVARSARAYSRIAIPGELQLATHSRVARHSRHADWNWLGNARCDGGDGGCVGKRSHARHEHALAAKRLVVSRSVQRSEGIKRLRMHGLGAHKQLRRAAEEWWARSSCPPPAGHCQ